MKSTPDSPKIESGPIKMMMIGKSILQMWVIFVLFVEINFVD